MRDKMDILREVGNTAAAHGSTALSEILGRKILLRLPIVDVLPCDGKSNKIALSGMVFTMQSHLLSGLQGRIVFLLDEQSAYKLIDMCYKLEQIKSNIGPFTEMGLSVIKEIGNIIISSYVNSLGLFLKRLIIPSFPILINAPLPEIINAINPEYNPENSLLMVQAIFEEEKDKIQGNFWLILSPETAQEIENICKGLLNSI
ncbi:MAG: chemotaxis protein CheC [Candidatus Omnitrophota bacterium]